MEQNLVQQLQAQQTKEQRTINKKQQ